MRLTITIAERDTILAALRMWQEQTKYQQEHPDAIWVSHDLMEIATLGGDHEPLTNEEIDDLCERINT